MNTFHQTVSGLVALACVGVGGVWLSHDALFWSGQRVSGTVRVVERVESSDGPIWNPVVEYRPVGEAEARLLRTGGSNPSAYAVGEQVSVVYLPSDPSLAKVHNVKEWSPPFVVALFGVVVGASALASRRRALAGAERDSALTAAFSGVDTSEASKVRAARRNSRIALGVCALALVLAHGPVALPGSLRGGALTTSFGAFAVAALLHLKTRRCPRCGQRLGGEDGPPLFGRLDDCGGCGLRFTDG